METSAQQCDNCYTTLHGNFCHKCGQQKKNYIRDLSGMVTEFFGEFSNWDARLWRTLWPLWFRPGYLGRRYVQGHRVPFVPPLRMYLLTSIIAFLILAQLIDKPELSSQATVNNPEYIETLTAPSEPYTLELPFLSETVQQNVNERFRSFIESPKLAVNKFFSLGPQMMFLLLPVFALLLKLLYIRSGRFYMEHLIIALYSHSFILQVGVVSILVGELQSFISWNWLANIVGGLEAAFLYWIPVYLFLCQKFYYQQGWVKTAVKFALVSLTYSLIFLSALLVVLALSVLST